MNDIVRQESSVIPVNQGFARDAWIDQTKYKEMY